MNHRTNYSWLYDLLFLLVLALAGYLRLTGIDWGEAQHQHPDENFLSGVLGNLQAHKCVDATIAVEVCPPEQRRWIGIGDYLNSRTSTLNPYNRGFSFFVYGNLPMTIVRVAAEALSQDDFFDVKLIGRQFSGIADLFTILMLYFVVSRLYDRRVALLASLFSALTVMQIQQSHFFTTDLFVNAFAFLAIYFAIAILDDKSEIIEQGLVNEEKRLETRDSVIDGPSTGLKAPISNPASSIPNSPFSSSPASNPSTTFGKAGLQSFDFAQDKSPVPSLQSPITNPSTSLRASLQLLFTYHPFLLSIGFGLALGMAMASKINIAPLAILLPAAFVLRYFMNNANGIRHGESPQDVADTDYWLLITACLVAGAFASLISFRIFQPYAFDGFGLNSQWIANILEQRAQAGGADLPWNLQWARRSHLYSFTNLTVWGLGLPLGILAWGGFLYMGWRIIKGERRHILLWGWTAAYFVWQSLQFNPTMRYQLPIYPLLAMMAAWLVFELAGLNIQMFKRFSLSTVLASVLGITVLALTVMWAFAFHSIYLRDEPRIAASRWIFQNIPGPINVPIEKLGDSVYNQPLPFPMDGVIQAGIPYDTTFVAQSDGMLNGIFLPHALNVSASSSTLKLTLSIAPDPTPGQTLAIASTDIPLSSGEDLRGDPLEIKFDQPVTLVRGEQFFLRFEISEGDLALSGAALANETDYDYPLPFRVDGFDAFGGIYRDDLNLQVYWDDNADKLNTFVDVLNQTDYILIPTAHQYSQITRVPERYPLTAFYYRELIGCPEDRDVTDCYSEALPGDFQGRLGFDLIAVFETYPTLGPIVINDQSAEEAFTFYDHPKVFVFKKNADFDAEQVRSILGVVDITKAVHLTPTQFDDYSDLLLPANRLAQQRAGGTWSELFNYNWIQNRYPVLGLLLWYFFIFVLGLAVYPLIRLAMPGLPDKGYPLSRALGLVLFGYLAWMGGSAGIPYTRVTIAIIFGLILVAGILLARVQRNELAEEWKKDRDYFLMIESLFLMFFLIDLVIRIGNPDLWHPARGGERPMDFSYFNAIIKGTSFPPYDPWFAGGYINYYYYGFVLVATPVKLLGIVPSIAYNFILPTLFAMVAMCAFSLGWNLLATDEDDEEDAIRSTPHAPRNMQYATLNTPHALIAGLSASFLTILIGNLGTIQLIYQKLQQLGALGQPIKDAGIFQRFSWMINGLLLTFKGASLPLGPGDWYWNPSRVLPSGGGNEITEFPLFTFIYSDLHAHMIAMPIMLLALSWALAVVAGHVKWQNRLSVGLGLVAGGLIIGALYPTNLSDIYTFLPIGLVALSYAIWRYADASSVPKRIMLTAGALFALTFLSFVMYQPYREWYSQAYSALDAWKGPFTPVSSYLTHWTVFLIVIVSWLAWETHEWMASTPISSLRKLRPWQLLIEGAMVLFVLALLVLQYNQSSSQYSGMSVGWIALPIAAWAGVLLLRPSMSDAKRFVLFLVGTALLITMVVEVVVVRGDIGRQNTIFKFYLQSWFLLAVSAGAAFAWTLPAYFKWLQGWRAVWQSAVTLAVSGALLFTVTGTMGKIRDRWILEAPHTLDSITFMKYASYDDFGKRLDLSEDYRAIRWMQHNVQESPVIVEANCPEYRWCTRFTIYTGLPGVVGWNWHQRQQRALMPEWVTDRVDAVTDFYNSADIETTRAFLGKYDVRYIVVGQLERAEYTSEGISKFEQYNGVFWKLVYSDGSTVIYEVIS